jgi:PAS domain S-box-containing protein
MPRIAAFDSRSRSTRDAQWRPAGGELWRQLFECLPEPAFMTDVAGRLLAANAAAARLLASRGRRLEGCPVGELVVEQDQPRILLLLARLKSSKRCLLETELDLRRARGSPLSAATRLVGLRAADGRLHAVGWVLRRIGQPRPLAERLQRTIQEVSDLRLALDQSAAVMGFDRLGSVNEVNERCCRILERRPEQLLGVPLAELALGEDFDAKLPDIWQTLTQGDVWGGELRVEAGRGRTRWLHSTVVPVLDESGRPSHYVAVLRDVTARRVATERLIEQEGLARLGAMAAVVAHEVRNPLAAARGALDVIGPRVANPEDRQILADVSNRLSKLNALVGDILLYARPRPVSRVDCELLELVESAMRDFRTDPLARGVTLELQRPESAIAVQVDAAAIQRALLNLLRNAAQAMHGRGRILVRVDSDEAHCSILIRDEGPGIPASLRERVFEPFFTTKNKGSGLGLPTSRRTIELHGGRLSLQPGPQGGTDAVVALPRRQAPPTLEL